MIIAHRGIWKTQKEMNSKQALLRAFTSGVGTELDVRDSGKRLLVSHDMPESADLCLGFEEAVNAWSAQNCPGYLAVDLKECGIAKKIKHLFRSADRYFCFGAPLPELLELRDLEIPFYTRVSEYEPEPLLYEEAAGVWLDCFFSDDLLQEMIQYHLHNGKKVCVVSAELNGRDPTAQWQLLKREGLLSDDVLLCTDRVEQAIAFFGRN